MSIELQYDDSEDPNCDSEDKTWQLEIIDEAETVEQLRAMYPHLVDVKGYEVCDENFRHAF